MAAIVPEIGKVDTNREISIERARQIRELGYDSSHDDNHGIHHLIDIAYHYVVTQPDPVKAGAMLHAIRAFETRHELVSSMQKDVEKFMHACDQEVKTSPGLVDDETRELRESLMTEELLGQGELIESMRNGDLVGIADGIADLMYVVLGTASAYGINVQPIFDEVQRSNMTKAVWDEETQSYKVIRRADGKILKPETFSPAEVEAVLTEQTSVETGVLQ